MSFFTSKVTPAPQKKVQEEEEGRNDGNDAKAPVEIHVMSLHDFQTELGGHRFPKIKSHETYRKEGLIKDYSFVDPDSNLLFISHEPVGTDHRDPRGEHVRHGTKVRGASEASALGEKWWWSTKVELTFRVSKVSCRYVYF